MTSTIERKIYKIFERIKIIPKGVIRELRPYELQEPNLSPKKIKIFDATPHYRFGSLEYDKIAREKKSHLN